MALKTTNKNRKPTEHQIPEPNLDNQPKNYLHISLDPITKIIIGIVALGIIFALL